MKIAIVRVQNFRALEDVEVPVRFLTALVGPNGAGKSSWLHAVGTFFSTERKLDTSDVYAEDPAREIAISITFDDLGEVLEETLDQYVQGGTITVVKKIDLAAGRPVESYHGIKRVNPDFDELRRQPATEGVKTYNALRKLDKYIDLPPDTAMGRIRPLLDTWEVEHPDDCLLALDDGKFFGMDGKSLFDFSDHIRFLLVPAVRDAIEDAGRSGTVPKLLEEEALSLVQENETVAETLSSLNTALKEAIRPEDSEHLRQLTADINETIGQIAVNASLHVDWNIAQLQAPRLSASVQVIEDSYRTSIDKAGHGVQRAIVMAVLQHHAALQRSRTSSEGTPIPRLILAIEEPELFQHPNRQRHLAEILRGIAGSDERSVAEKTQVLIATHSPLFVNLHYFDCVRRLHKEAPIAGGPMATRVSAADLEAVAEKLWHLRGKPGQPFTGASLRPRIQALLNPWMNEGFFASKIVLVEGESDRAALMAVAQASEINLEERGISVIPCGSKMNLDRPYLIFTELGIPTYMMWDGDFEVAPESNDDSENAKRKREKLSASARENRTLLHLFGQPAEDFPEGVSDYFAVHRIKIEATLKAELGEELYKKAVGVAQEAFSYNRREDVLKSPAAMAKFLEVVREDGGELTFIPQVIAKIVALGTAQPYVPGEGPQKLQVESLQ